MHINISKHALTMFSVSIQMSCYRFVCLLQIIKHFVPPTKANVLLMQCLHAKKQKHQVIFENNTITLME